jgi:hypothetical protein
LWRRPRPELGCGAKGRRRKQKIKLDLSAYEKKRDCRCWNTKC